MYKLELVNKKTKEVTIFDDIVDINYGEKLFFNFEINATQLADGEYTLSLYEDGKLIVTDTLCVGDFDVVGLQYKKGEAIYIETKLESKTQDKSVEVSDIATTIIPDVGYDAMTTVKVNAQPVYDDAYNAGNADGYESGIRAQKEKLESIEITANGVYSKEDGYNNIVVEVPDVNGSYDAGYSDGIEQGIVQGKEYQKEQLTNIEITSNGTYEREDGYKNVVVNVKSDSELDFSSIGYTAENAEDANRILNADIAYTQSLIDEFYSQETPNPRTFFSGNKKLRFAPIVDFNRVPSYYSAYLYFEDCVSLIYVPLMDISKISNLSFGKCRSLQYIPQFDTSNLKSINFQMCESLITIPELDFSGITTMDYTFNGCSSLVSIPHLNTSNVTNMTYAFATCSSIETIPQLDMSKVTNVDRIFQGCSKLVTLPLFDWGNVTTIKYVFQNASNVTNLGGFKNLKIDWNDNTGLAYCSKLTYQSIMNVINNLYDFRANGDSSTTRTLKINTNTMALLTDDDKAIATAKGWILTA